MRSKFFLGLFVSILALTGATFGQVGTGTVHGNQITFPPGTILATAPAGDSIAYYNIYRCTGNATACTTTAPITGNWAVIATGSNGDTTAAPDVFVDPAAGLVAGTTYTYAVTTVDTNGNESAFSPSVTLTFSVIPNPLPPPSCSGKVI